MKLPRCTAGTGPLQIQSRHLLLLCLNQAPTKILLLFQFYPRKIINFPRCCLTVPSSTWQPPLVMPSNQRQAWLLPWRRPTVPKRDRRTARYQLHQNRRRFHLPTVLRRLIQIHATPFVMTTQYQPSISFHQRLQSLWARVGRWGWNLHNLVSVRLPFLTNFFLLLHLLDFRFDVSPSSPAIISLSRRVSSEFPSRLGERLGLVNLVLIKIDRAQGLVPTPRDNWKLRGLTGWWLAGFLRFCLEEELLVRMIENLWSFENVLVTVSRVNEIVLGQVLPNEAVFEAPGVNKIWSD